MVELFFPNKDYLLWRQSQVLSQPNAESEKQNWFLMYLHYTGVKIVIVYLCLTGLR
jgi:hypothetical protein